MTVWTFSPGNAVLYCACISSSSSIPNFVNHPLTRSVCVRRLQHLRANLPGYEVGLYEQNVLTFLFYTNHDLLKDVLFEDSPYGLNCW